MKCQYHCQYIAFVCNVANTNNGNKYTFKNKKCILLKFDLTSRKGQRSKVTSYLESL